MELKIYTRRTRDYPSGSTGKFEELKAGDHCGCAGV